MPEPLKFDIRVDNVAAVAAFEGLARAMSMLSSRTTGIERTLSMPGAAGATQNLRRLEDQTHATAQGMLGLANPQVMQGLEGFRGKVMTIASAMVGMQIGITSLEHAMHMMTESFAKGAQLMVLSRTTNQSVSDLVTMQKALHAAGMSEESLRMYLMMLNRSLATTSMGARGVSSDFRRMGLDAASLKQLPAKEQLLAIAEGLKKVGGAAEQTKVLRDIFGRSGPQLQAAFKNEDFMKSLGGPTSNYAKLMERNAPMFESITVGMREMKERFQEFAAVISEAVAPALDGLLSQFKGIDGSEIGKAFKVLAEPIKLVIGYMRVTIDAINFLMGAFGKASGAVAMLAKGIVVLGMAIMAAKIGDFVTAILKKTVALVGGIVQLKAETAEVNRNTAAWAANSGARGGPTAAGGGGVIPFGGRGTGRLGTGQVGPSVPVEVSNYSGWTGEHKETRTPEQLSKVTVGAGLAANSVDRLGMRSKETGGAMAYLGGQLQNTSTAGLSAAVSMGLFMGTLVTAPLVAWITELNGAVDAYNRVNDARNKFIKEKRETDDPTTIEEKKTQLKEKIDARDAAKALAKTENEEVENAANFFHRAGPIDQLRFKGKSKQDLQSAGIIERGGVYYNTDAGVLHQKAAEDAERLVADREKDISGLRNKSNADLFHSGGLKDYTRVEEELKGTNDEIPELLKPDKWESTEQKILQVAKALRKIVEESQALQMKLAETPAEKLAINAEQSAETAREFNRKMGTAWTQEQLQGRADTLESQYTKESKDEKSGHFGKSKEEIRAAAEAEAVQESRVAGVSANYRVKNEGAPVTKESVLKDIQTASALKQQAEMDMAKAEKDKKLPEVHFAAARLFVAEEMIKKAKQNSSEIENQIHLTSQLVDVEGKRVNRAIDLAKVRAEAADNFAAVVQIDQQKRLGDMIRENQKSLIEGNANMAPSAMGDVLDPEQLKKYTELYEQLQAAKAGGDKEKQKELGGQLAAMPAGVIAGAEASKARSLAGLAKDKLDSEIEAIRLRAQGNETAAAEVEKAQKLKELTRSYAENIAKATGGSKDDLAVQKEAAALAKERIDKEGAPQRQKSKDELEAMHLRYEGHEAEAVDLEKKQKILEKEKDYVAQGFGKKSLGMAEDFVKTEFALKYSKGVPRITDSRLSIGADVLPNAGRGAEGITRMGSPLIGGLAGQMGAPLIASAASAIGAKGAEAVGSSRVNTDSDYLRQIATGTAETAKNTEPEKPSDPNGPGGVTR